LNFSTSESETNKRQNLWAEEYPYRTQDVGDFLDNVLHKTYRWMYGFVLIGEQNHIQSSGKDLAHTLNSIVEVAAKGFRPESTVAAAQLYRCIVRAYAGGRRTPPKAALELVSSALPPLRESDRSKDLRRYVFSANEAYFDLDQLASLVKKGEKWDSPFASIKDFLLVTNDSLNQEMMTSEESEAMYVRRGLSSRLASGPLPLVSGDSRQKSDSGSDDDRTQTTLSEIEISKKFSAILDDLCLSDLENCEGWYRAAQCLTMKVDLIADRLGYTQGFGRLKDFSVPSYRAYRGKQSNRLAVEELEKEQTAEDSSMDYNNVSYLGNNLSVYVHQSWSSYSSLRVCEAKIKEYLNVAGMDEKQSRIPPMAVWKEIESKYLMNDFLGWQEAWGGLFVEALRKLSLRFMCIPLYILQSRSETGHREKILMSELCEAIGIALYSELMASQKYGWPMQKLTSLRKRKLAATAKLYFEAATDLVQNSTEKDDDSEERATWDLVFMIGKVRLIDFSLCISEMVLIEDLEFLNFLCFSTVICSVKRRLLVHITTKHSLSQQKKIPHLFGVMKYTC
jgi:hypothetical protein